MDYVGTKESGTDVATQADAGTYVTSLPGSPSDGQEIYYAADASNGVIWHLRYRSAASGSYKWEYLGGPPMSDYDDSFYGTTSTSYVDLTGGPSFTLPLAGDYIVTVGLTAYSEDPGWYYSTVGVKNGTASTNYFMDVVARSYAGGVAVIIQPMYREHRYNALTAATLKLQYVTSGGTSNFGRRYLAARPIRVG